MPLVRGVLGVIRRCLRYVSAQTWVSVGWLARGTEVVGKLYAVVVGEGLSDGERYRVDQAQEEAAHGPADLCSTYTQRVARSYGGKQAAALVVVWYLRQVFHINTSMCTKPV